MFVTSVLQTRSRMSRRGPPPSSGITDGSCNIDEDSMTKQWSYYRFKEMMMMPSKPIPIPPCNKEEEADHRQDGDNEITSEAQMYDAATWRMFQLISLSRLTRATSCVAPRPTLHYFVGPSPPPQHHVLLTQENDHTIITPAQSSPSQQLDDTREHSLPEPPSLLRHSPHMEEVFIMD